MKPFKYSGVWWLPSKKKKVSGEVTYTRDTPTKLVLHGIFERDINLEGQGSLGWYSIILGLTEDGQAITLVNCQVTHFNLSFGDKREVEQECMADIALIGTHFPDPQHILFSKVDVYYSYLPQWAGIFPYRGYQGTFDEVRASTAKGIIIVQPVKRDWSELVKEADLPETVRIRFEVQRALPLQEWMTQFGAPLQNFISLATQRPNALSNMVVYVKQIDQSNSDIPEIPVQVAFAPAVNPIPTNKSTVPETILFSLQEIAHDFSNVIDNWLTMANELKSVHELFFGVQYTKLYLDLQFLLISQAIEVYQDNRFDKTTLPEEEFQSLMDKLLAACPEERKDWLKDALAHSNNATYRQQLKNIVKKTLPILGPLLGKNSKMRETFVEVAYNTRNFLTHHTKELAPHAANGAELLYITRCLSLALQVCLMKDLGWTEQRLIEMLRKHEDYKVIPAVQTQIHLEKLTIHS